MSIEKNAEAVRDMVREGYAGIARNSGSCCGGATANADTIARHIGYSEEDVRAVPAGANLGLGCGNPLALANVQPGETVLDLGSGAGFDALLAAQAVGPTGCVVGIDMTPEMLARAEANVQKAGVPNVEFRRGYIEALPVEDASVDVVISNCVINLSPEKPRVFAEAMRVLKPGGRLLVSDLVLTRPLPESVRASVEAYVGCIAGASLKDDYIGQIRDAGFADVAVVEERGYGPSADMLPDVVKDAKAWDAVLSVKVRAVKPLR
jgi:SAM-dependent methyltransferase